MREWQLEADKNFDDLAPKFKQKVYGNLKGKIRMAVIRKDLTEFCPRAVNPSGSRPVTILDAGCGHGPFSLELARLGHPVTLCDHSGEMLAIAGQTIREKELDSTVRVVHAPIQALARTVADRYDLIFCHAVLEWVTKPRVILDCLMERLNPGGFLSLTFYNRHGMIYKNLLRTNYKKIIRKAYKGWPGSLTPANPLTPEQVLTWIGDLDITLLCHSGMRVFYDYILNPEDREKSPETVMALELEFSRQLPFRDLGRYQHLLCRKTP